MSAGSRNVLEASRVALPDSGAQGSGSSAAGPSWPHPTLDPQREGTRWRPQQPSGSWSPSEQRAAAAYPTVGPAATLSPWPPQPPTASESRPAAAAAVADDSNDEEVEAADGGGRIIVAQQRQPLAPVVWSAVGRAAGTAWTVLKLCNRYVLMPALSWGLHVLKAYLERQIAIQRAMARPCHVPKYGEAEVRQATDELSFTRRALGTPYGMVAYLTSLRGAAVAVRPIPLNSLKDVDAFWAEEAAGRALLAAGCHPHVVPYLGCCPALACHVYEQRPHTCSLRGALLPASPHAAGPLAGWEGRLALCAQLAAAALHCLRCGVALRDLATANIALRIGSYVGDPATSVRAGGGEADVTGGGSLSGSGTAGGELHLWLAPACGFVAPLSPHAAAPGAAATAGQPDTRTPGQPQQRYPRVPVDGPVGPSVEAKGAEPDGAVAVTARGLGRVLMQVLAGADAAAPSAAAVIEALAEGHPSRLLSPAVAPPLTDAQAWPLLAAIYTLLDWGRPPKHADDATDGAAGGFVMDEDSDWILLGTRHGYGASQEGCRLAAAAAGRDGGGTPGGGGGGRGSGGGGEDAAALQSNLVRELLPALAELQRQVRQAAEVQRSAQRGAVAAAASLGPRGAAPAGAAGPAGSAAGTTAEDPFAEATAPPLPSHAYPYAHAPPPPPPPATAPARRDEHTPSAPPLHPPGGAAALPHHAAAAGALQPPVSGAARAAAPAPAGKAPPPPPAEFVCPITHELMEDPVVAADGHSYERAAISQWLASAARRREGRATSPLTGAALPHAGLTPNYTLRSLIRDWRERQGFA